MQTQIDSGQGMSTDLDPVMIPGHCPVCESEYMTFARRLPRRIGGHVDLFYCLECESASSPFSPPVPENDVNDWHRSVRERNIQWGKELFDALGSDGPLVDVGCGIGALISSAAERGISGVGYDLNDFACEYGRATYELDLRNEVWLRSTTPAAKILTCISVLEHIHEPRPLIGELIGAAQDMDAVLFISVPFFTRNNWPSLKTDNLQSGHIFEVPHAHVTHFSPRGFEKVCTDFGARSLEPLTVARAWRGYVIR